MFLPDVTRLLHGHTPAKVGLKKYHYQRYAPQASVRVCPGGRKL